MKARNKRRRHSTGRSSATAVVDPHAKFLMKSSEAMFSLFAEMSADGDFSENVEQAFAERVGELAEVGSRFAPVRLAETARLAFFPLAPEGEVVVHPEGGAFQLELLLLLAVTGRASARSSGQTVRAGEMSRSVQDVRELIDLVTNLGMLRPLASVDRDDPLAWLSFSVQGSEVAMRNSSYPEAAQATVLELLDGNDTVRAGLESSVGFTATDALSVLAACDAIQKRKLNDRGQRVAATHNVIDAGADVDEDQLFGAVGDALMALFEPPVEDCTVGADELAVESGLGQERIERILDFFSFDPGEMTPLEAATRFVQGDNPWRTAPLLRDDSGRVLLLHNAHCATAIKERLEEHLKPLKAWSVYAKHRGDMLEERVLRAMRTIVPTGTYRNGFEFFIPGTEEEAADRVPADYTKRVECDHLVLVDDVAFIIEDKAVAFSALARGGKSTRQRADLRGIITKAAEQAGRVRTAIVRDGGMRVEGEGWVDLGHIREIHTIAVSLDDIPTVFTATADLLQAGLIDLDNVPWTVSLHDLELIADLVDRPAEFLLYLRRRRDPVTTMMYMAPDELDLFLYFYETGLWVEPDPDLVREAFPFLPAPSPGDFRRYRDQGPGIITSRTDALDRWYYSRDHTPRAPKPTMAVTAIVDLVDELERRQCYGWLSIGATLRAGNAADQERLARHPKDLLDNPRPDGRGRSLTVPMTGTVNPEEGWILVWATKPATVDTKRWVTNIRGYLKAKGHQLKIPRVVAFAFDEGTRELFDVLYEGDTGSLDPALMATLRALQPASALQSRLPPEAKKRPGKGPAPK